MKHLIRNPWSAIFLFTFVLAAVAPSASAQGLGSIVGTVTDPSGSVVSGATVSVVNHGNGQSRQVGANGQGYFVIPSLPPAVYDLTVNASSFAAFTRQGVTLLADQTLTVDVTLSLAQARQTVSVQSNVVQVDTSTSTLNQVVEQKRIVDLPLNGRNAVSLALLVPGTIQAPPNNDDQGQYKTLPVAITVSANGSRGNQTGFNLDGSSNNDIYTNVNQPFPFPDALQEFSVQTSNYSARYGGNSGAVVNAITKSGTNDFHGDLFEFVRNAVFNGRNYFASTRDQLKRNQFGGTVGGPIVRNKTFFFFGYQQTQIRDIQNGNTAFVPTPAEINNGDFSAIPNQIYNPATGAPYPGNQIPTGQFDKAALAFTKYLPIASASPTGQVFYGLPLSQSFNEYVVRGDQAFGAKDHLTMRYYLDKYNDNPFLNPANYLAVVSESQIYSHNAFLGETHIFTSNLLNDVRLNFSRVSTNAGPPPNSISVDDLGLTIYQPPIAKSLDGISVSGYFSSSSFPPSIMNRDSYSLNDDLSWVHGRHSLTFGGSFLIGQVLLRDGYLYGGTFSFTADNTANTAVGGATGNALASFLLGSLRTFQQGAGETKDNRVYYWSGYGQDDFHVTHRLTLNLGLRWEPFYPWIETKGRVEQFRAANYYAGVKSTQFINAPAGLLFPGDAGMPKHGVNPSYANFSPRVGFAVDLKGDGTMSLRGGAGAFYDAVQVGIENNRFVDVSPFSLQVSVTTPQGPFINPYLNLPNPFPAPLIPPANSAFPAPVLVVTYDPSHNSQMQAPVTYNYNLIFEQQMSRGWLMRMAYVGSQSRHQTETVELNPAVYTPGSTLSTDQRRIFQGFGSIGQGTQDVNANYNSLQATLQRRLNRLTVLANYTYSKSLDDVPNGQGNAGIASQNDSTLPWTSPDRHAFDYGPSDFDHRHILILSYVWDAPAFSNLNGFARAAVGGWEATGILRAETGTGFTMLAGSDRSQTGLGQDRAVLLPGQDPYGRGACGSAPYCVSYLNKAAFATPAIGTYGNVGKNSFNGPGFLSWDVGLLKNFPIAGDRYRFQFHAEFFNVLNKTNLNNPSATLTSSTFGQITSAGDPRIGQLALKFLF